jgi:hypothetical protein
VKTSWARSGSLVTGTTLLAGVLAYVTLALFAHLRGPAPYVSFAVSWAVYYAVAGAMGGLQQEMTRAASAPTAVGPFRAWLLAVPLATGAVVAAVVAATSPWWDRQHGPSAGVVLAAALGAFGLAGLVSVLGLLSARRNWGWLCVLLLLDATVRLLAVWALADGARWQQMLAIASGSLVWVPLLPWLAPRLGTGSLGRPRQLAQRIALMVAATGLSGLLIAGLPALVAVTTSSLTPATTGLLASLILFRSPLILVVNGLRPLLLVHLLDSSRPVARTVAGAWAACAAATLCAMAGAAWLGRPVLRLTMGSGFEVNRTEAVVLVGSAGLLAVLTVSGLAFVALDRHVVATAGWALAVAVTVAALLLPADVSTRVLVAVIAGPAVPVLLHGVLLSRTGGVSRQHEPRATSLAKRAS